MAKGALRLKWKNKFSGEEGFVKTVSASNRCFFATFDPNEAKGYASAECAAAKKDLATLEAVGETQQNYFFFV